MLPSYIIAILDSLYKNYYLNKNFSEVTSSHWQKFGKMQNMAKTVAGYDLEGIGFGAHVKKNYCNAILRIPSYIYITRMLSKSKSETVASALQISADTGRLMSYDFARMVLTADLLFDYLGDLNSKKIVIIGDGYGNLGCLLKKLYPSAQITFINLGRTLAFDVFYSGLAFQEYSHKLLSTEESKSSCDFNYLPAELVSSVNIEADLFINIASMQEMNLINIKQYFDIIRSQISSVHFYCCNRLEKILPDGTITRFFDYGWHQEDEILLEGLCPWHQIAPINRPPFFRKFDGPTYHKLIKI